MPVLLLWRLLGTPPYVVLLTKICRLRSAADGHVATLESSPYLSSR